MDAAAVGVVYFPLMVELEGQPYIFLGSSWVQSRCGIRLRPGWLRLNSVPSGSSPGLTSPLGSCCVVLIRALLFRSPAAILDSEGGRGRGFLILASLRSTTGRLRRQFSSCRDPKVAFISRMTQKRSRGPWKPVGSDPGVAGTDGKSVAVVSVASVGEAGAEAGSRDALPGFRTFTAAAIINSVPTETSPGSGVNTCQSGSEPRRIPSYSAAPAAPPPPHPPPS